MPGLWRQRLPSAWALLLLPFLPLLLPAAPAPHRGSYKPVIVVHGLFDSSYSFRHLLDYINETHPGTVVTVLDLFDGRESLRPLWEQVQGFREAVVPIMEKAPEGVHLICYSQGGLVCRALLSVMDEHNVDSFISLSSPQMGQYGDTDYLKWLSPFLPWLRLGSKHQVFNCGFTAAAVASPGLAVPEENPAPAHLRGLPGHSGHF
ncbi:palmitoyl-protein thioesterase 2, isoform CRA_d [Rattus norvegicus]|uniref:palmitoyl-CoA hydrolase n=1 Tax=Rattus norvegicus TaxID=10116 RepID=A6KTH8_RAT|nr:palmitoyl-protein thioesterase 2, isoform CRA_d [Rattus norvegicus]